MDIELEDNKQFISNTPRTRMYGTYGISFSAIFLRLQDDFIPYKTISKL